MEYKTIDEICIPFKSDILINKVKRGTGTYPLFGAKGIVTTIDSYQQEDQYISIIKWGAGVGRAELRPAYSSIVATMLGIIPNQNVDIKWLCYLLQSLHLEQYATNAVIPNLYYKDFCNRKIKVPDIYRQKEITNHLNAIQTIIDYRKKQLDSFDTLIKARFVEMFGNETNPKNWPVINVEEIADVTVGVVIKPASYYTDSEHGVKAFRSLNIGEMTIKDNDWVYFSKEGNEKNAKSILSENDLLVIRSGAPGTACIVTKEYSGCNAIDIIIARPNTKAINPYYLCMYTNMPHGKRQIDEGTGGAAQQHFNVGKYNKLRLMLPPKEKQDQFAEFIFQINKSKVVVQKALGKAQTLFDSLMQQYLG